MTIGVSRFSDGVSGITAKVGGQTVTAKLDEGDANIKLNVSVGAEGTSKLELTFTGKAEETRDVPSDS